MAPRSFLLVPSGLVIHPKRGIYISPTITPIGTVLPWAVLKYIKVALAN